MKPKQKKLTKTTLSDKIADALTVKPRADIEDDQVFGTKPQTLTKGEFWSSESEDEAAISDFRKRNINLLSEVSKKYEGQVVSKKDVDTTEFEGYEESDSEDNSRTLTAQDLALFDDTSTDSEPTKDAQTEKKLKPISDNNQKEKSLSELEDFSSEAEGDDYSIMQNIKKQIQGSDEEDEQSDDAETQKKLKTTSEMNQNEKSVSDSEGFSSEVESDDYSIMQNVKKQIQGSSDEEEQSDEAESDEGESEEEEDGDGYDISEMNEPIKEDFEHVKKQNVSEEAKKGEAVRNQLLIWEGLLEMRIHLQRCMNTANQMPLPEGHEELKKNNEFAEECDATRTSIATVLDKFLTLQNALLKNYPETKNLSNKKESLETNKNNTDKAEDGDEEILSDTDNEEIPSDTEDEENAPKDVTPKKINGTAKTQTKKRKLDDYEKELSITHKAFKPFRDSTINKWDEKTRIATASAMKNKNTPTNTVIQRIQYILSDKEKLVKKTQLKRSDFDIVGYRKPEIEEEGNQNGTDIGKIRDRKDDDEYITEIFDDSDFYHQLLRELIEFKSADVFDPVQLTRQWITLQQMRSKMKKKVDTKATKGRKIKYVVHNKLVNYMAPEKCTTWTDESANELFSSLFGKMFENNNVGLNANLGDGFKLN